MTRVVLWVGTSGWQYADWRNRLYAGVPQRRWFEHALARFRTLEINASFYRLPARETFESWRARSPDDAVLAVKASRYLTHVKRLREPAEPVARLLGAAAGLGDKLGPVLVQLPPTLARDVGALDAALAAFGGAVRVAVEPRHESWWHPDVRAVLERHGAALVWADRGSRPVAPLWQTAAWGYVRFHHGRPGPRWPAYGPTALRSWATRIATAYAAADVFVYFNNDPNGAAVDDAREFARAAAGLGLVPTRT